MTHDHRPDPTAEILLQAGMLNLTALDPDKVRELIGSARHGSPGSGASLVLWERALQQVAGYTPELDDEQTDGQLAAAAANYLDLALLQAVRPDVRESAALTTLPLNVVWPWYAGTGTGRVRSGWAPDPSPLVNLVKAAALLVAEIERLGRADARVPCTGRCGSSDCDCGMVLDDGLPT